MVRERFGRGGGGLSFVIFPWARQALSAQLSVLVGTLHGTAGAVADSPTAKLMVLRRVLVFLRPPFCAAPALHQGLRCGRGRLQRRHFRFWRRIQYAGDEEDKGTCLVLAHVCLFPGQATLACWQYTYDGGALQGLPGLPPSAGWPFAVLGVRLVPTCVLVVGLMKSVHDERGLPTLRACFVGRPHSMVTVRMDPHERLCLVRVTRLLPLNATHLLGGHICQQASSSFPPHVPLVAWSNPVGLHYAVQRSCTNPRRVWSKCQWISTGDILLSHHVC